MSNVWSSIIKDTVDDSGQTGKTGWFADVTYCGVKKLPNPYPYGLDRSDVPDDETVFVLSSDSEFTVTGYECPGHSSPLRIYSNYLGGGNQRYNDIDELSIEQQSQIFFDETGLIYKIIYRGNTTQIYNPNVIPTRNVYSYQLFGYTGCPYIFKGKWADIQLYMATGKLSNSGGNGTEDRCGAAYVIRISDCFQYPNPTIPPTDPYPDPTYKDITWTCFEYELGDKNRNSIWTLSTSNFEYLGNDKGLSYFPIMCSPPENGVVQIRTCNVKFYYKGGKCPDGTIECDDGRGNKCCIDCCELGAYVNNQLLSMWI